MYSREKSRKHHQNGPSFSSTLLDEIYRSIDANEDNTEDSKFFYRDKLVNFRGNDRVEDEEMAGYRRTCLVEKWMLKEENENLLARRDSLATESENKSFQDKDLVYFSSNSSSSDSSGALSSSSDTEFFSSSTESRVSCFSSVARPKPVRIGEKPRKEVCEDYRTEDDKSSRSKSRALKIYAHLRKVKQPISPGGKLTSFINSLFNHANEKKSKNSDSSKGIQVQELKSIKASSTCSSRSCLSKDSPKSREKMRNGVQRTVRFDPVSVILNEESRPCGSKSINGEDSGRQVDDLRLRLRVENRKVEEEDTSRLDLSRSRRLYHKKSDDMYGFRKYSYTKDEEDDDDSISESSSDLFEIDHLSLFGNNRYCEELPMYETTDHYGKTNRGLVRY